ncbi:hypothetical protein B0H67DRAFT_238552 [Lasiosphaeris hirsuta]|uniref:Uncharacterized protein n=1 Tax=Lasiosphaeris hirsuta TaxID=260670 RepID=A0AA40DT88_9PEZI|nr:hypothetical protein B0H67DRAFT_238552 [Lasiosphaeris hirsuta]
MRGWNLACVLLPSSAFLSPSTPPQPLLISDIPLRCFPSTHLHIYICIFFQPSRSWPSSHTAAHPTPTTTTTTTTTTVTTTTTTTTMASPHRAFLSAKMNASRSMILMDLICDVFENTFEHHIHEYSGQPYRQGYQACVADIVRSEIDEVWYSGQNVSLSCFLLGALQSAWTYCTGTSQSADESSVEFVLSAPGPSFCPSTLNEILKASTPATTLHALRQYVTQTVLSFYTTPNPVLPPASTRPLPTPNPSTALTYHSLPAFPTRSDFQRARMQYNLGALRTSLETQLATDCPPPFHKPPHIAWPVPLPPTIDYRLDINPSPGSLPPYLSGLDVAVDWPTLTIRPTLPVDFSDLRDAPLDRVQVCFAEACARLHAWVGEMRRVGVVVPLPEFLRRGLGRVRGVGEAATVVARLVGGRGRSGGV